MYFGARYFWSRSFYPLMRQEGIMPTFDSHCHIFNIHYLLREAANMLWDTIRGEYPYEKDYSLDKSRRAQSPKDTIREFFRWLCQLTDACTGSESENMEFLNTAMANSFPVKSDDTRIVPLMMDIYYMFAHTLDKNQDIPAAARALRKTSASPETVDAFRKELRSLMPDQGESRSIDNILKDILENNIDTITSGQFQTDVYNYIDRSSSDIKWTWGFSSHMNALATLVNRQPSKLYPFFAIDPRRPGIIDLLLQGKLVTRSGPFYGVKLYPRLGYHPLAKPLMRVYEYCADNNLPITTHTSNGGFPTWDTPCSTYGNPANFEPLFIRFKDKLRINFAHFGNGSVTWGKTIQHMMKTYCGVYSDLSCYTHKNDLNSFKENFWNDPDVRKRTMFGTDYDVMYFTAIGKIDIDAYYKAFCPGYFSTEEVAYMSQELPHTFLFGE